MTIEQREELIELYDIYYSLLTDKQKEYFEEYYFDDLRFEDTGHFARFDFYVNNKYIIEW